jgi:hypothetical protein
VSVAWSIDQYDSAGCVRKSLYRNLEFVDRVKFGYGEHCASVLTQTSHRDSDQQATY